MDVDTCSRSDLEMAIIEYDILPCDMAGLKAIGEMTTEELRAAVSVWILAGDECGNC